MVSHSFIKKTKLSLRRAVLLVIALSVVAVLFLGDISFAQAKIDDVQLKQIKTILDITNSPFVSNYSETDLKEVLNKIINKKEPDITYGILIMSSWNEMEFMDMVLSQGYKKRSTDYFNQILDEKLSLARHWTGVGQDFYNVISERGVALNPVFALTLNTFSISSEVVNVFIAFENISQVKKYNGLWTYFDQRRFNTSHKEAWSDAKDIIGWAVRSTSFFGTPKLEEENELRLESRFAELWDKWGPYAEPFGISEQAKTQVKNGLQNTFVTALETHTFIKEEPKLSLGETLEQTWNNLVSQLGQVEENIQHSGQALGAAAQNILNNIKSTLTALNPFLPAAIVQDIYLQNEPIAPFGGAETKEGLAAELVQFNESAKLSLGEEEGPIKLSLAEMQEELDDILEIVDVINQETSELVEKELIEKGEAFIESDIENNSAAEEPVAEAKEQDNEGLEDIEEPEQIVTDRGSETEQVVLCEKKAIQPVKNKVIINEIAWMGTVNSANYEWIELKNISGGQIDLTGWQLLDKDDQIKIVFEEKILEAGELFLLERTNDSSVSDVEADLIYTGALGNSNEILYLFDEKCGLQEGVGSLIDWPFGDNSSKRTMERKANLDWQTSASAGGTPKNENSSGYVISFSSGISSPSSPADATAIQTPEILITEIQIQTASSTEHDFIEIYNPATSSVDISSFQLKKRTSTGNEYSVRMLSENSVIAAQGYFLWLNSDYASSSQISASATSSQTLAKDNSIALFDENGNIIDALAWGSSTNPFVEDAAFSENPEADQGLGRRWSSTTQDYTDTDNNQNDFEIQNPTPGEQNQNQTPPQNQLPIAQFVFNPAEPIINQEIVLDASSSTDPDGQITSFIWDFGDGNTASSSLATSTYNYASSSDFIISLQVVDNDGATSSLATTTVSVATPETPSLSVVINEIAWMGTSATNSSDEWIELYNNTTSTVDLTGWTLAASDGTPSITFSTSTGITTFPSQSFFLLERTDDTTVFDITADQIYTGALGNGEEKLELRDADNNLIDIVDCSDGWFAGTTTEFYVSMERINSNASGTDSDNWANNNLITRNGLDADGNKVNATPKSENSVSKSETEISDIVTYPTLTYLGSPYIISSTLIIPKGTTLSIEPAVILKFYIPSTYGPHDGAYLKVQGNLEAVGQTGQEIIFTSTGNVWPGILFEDTEMETEISSHLEYVKIEKARSWEASVYSAVKVINKAISIRNSIFDDYRTTGIKLINSSSTIENVQFLGKGAGTSTVAINVQGGSPTIKSSTISENSYGIILNTYETCLSNPNFQISSNTFSANSIPIYLESQGFPCFSQNQALGYGADDLNNMFDGILLAGGRLSQDTFWQADLPLSIKKTGLYLENATLTISSGMTIKFQYSTSPQTRAYLEARSGSNLMVQGAAATTTFTSARENPSAGNWEAIYFREGSFGILENVKLEYGGFKPTLNDCLRIESDNVTLTNVEKEFCSPY